MNEATTNSGAPKVLLDLLAARGPSGYETAPAAVWRDAAKGFAEVSTDVLGTPLARVAPKHDAKSPPQRLLVIGHIDEIGLIVTHIDDQGYLWFGSVGGWDAQILVGQRVALDTREGPVTGVVGKKPIHLLRDEDRKKVAEIRDLHIDIGAVAGADIDMQVADLRHLLAVLIAQQMDRLLAHHTRHRTLSRVQRHPLTHEDLRVPTADRPEPQIALIVDVRDDQPDLVDVPN